MKTLHEKLKTGICYKLLISSFLFYLIILIRIIFFKCASPFLCVNFVEHLEKHMTITETFIWNLNISYVSIFDNTIYRYLEILLNILVFIPLGLYLPLLFKNFNYFRDFIITTLFVLFVETTQLFTRLGVFSFFDLLVNLLGFSIGSFLFFIFKKYTSDLVINYIQLGILIIAFPTFIYAIISVPMNWDLYKAAFDFVNYPYIF